jgi:hypothetical protein
VLLRSLKISAGLLFIDGLTAFLLRGFVYPFETLGDMLLVETASLFLLAGFVDFGTSLGFVQFRKSVFASKESFSSEKRKEAERRATILVGSGIILFSILILLAKIKV